MVDTIRWLKDPLNRSSPPLSAGGDAFLHGQHFSHTAFGVYCWLSRKAMNVTDPIANPNSRISFGFIRVDLGCMKLTAFVVSRKEKMLKVVRQWTIVHGLSTMV